MTGLKFELISPNLTCGSVAWKYKWCQFITKLDSNRCEYITIHYQYTWAHAYTLFLGPQLHKYKQQC